MSSTAIDSMEVNRDDDTATVTPVKNAEPDVQRDAPTNSAAVSAAGSSVPPQSTPSTHGTADESKKSPESSSAISHSSIQHQQPSNSTANKTPPAQHAPEKKSFFSTIFRRGSTTADDNSLSTADSSGSGHGAVSSPAVVTSTATTTKHVAGGSGSIETRTTTSKPLPDIAIAQTAAPVSTSYEKKLDQQSLPVASASETDMFDGMQTSSPSSSVTSATRVVKLPEKKQESPAISTRQKVEEPSSSESQKKMSSIMPVVSSSAEKNDKKSSVVKAVGIVTPPTDNIGETLRRLGGEIIAEMSYHMEEMSSERTALKSVIEKNALEIASLDVEVQRVRAAIQDMEDRQQALGAAEDFEGAAALADPLEAHRIKVETDLRRITELNNQSALSRAKIIELQKEMEVNLQNNIRGLGNLRRQQEEEWERHEKVWTQSYNQNEQKVKAEEDRVRLEQLQISQEEESLLDESSKIESLIHGQTEALTVSKVSLESKLHSTLGEIAELELALAAKKAEEIELRSELKSTEAGITDVRRKYERQLQRLYDRKTAVTAAQNECSKEALAIAKDRQQVEHINLDFKRTKSEIDTWLNGTSEEVMAVVEFLEIMKTSIDSSGTHPRDSNNSAGDSEGSEETILLQRHVSACTASLAEASLELVKSEALWDALQAESKDIVEKLPLLEADKKSHANMKRFKEAAVVSKDIKMMSTRKEDIEKESIDLISVISLKKDDIRHRTSLLLDAKEVLKAAERKSDILVFESLLRKAKRLNKSKLRIESKISIDNSVIAPIAAKIVSIEIEVAIHN